MISVDFGPRALAAIKYHSARYESLRPGLGRAFIDEVDSVVACLRDFPETAPVLRRGARRAVLFHFPFCIVYRVTPGLMEVVGVFPTAGDPRRVVRNLARATKQR